MSTNVNPAVPCPQCQRPLPAGVLAGLCPACLLAQGVDTATEAGAPPGRFQPPTVEAVAKLFPQLEILSLLGAGGMGAVYRARQPALDRDVALKILPAGSPDGGSFPERFQREARALARLNHPNIVAVYEFGQVGSLLFFVMEFVEGANLRQMGKAGRLSPRGALQIIPQVCDALQYAHDEGVVHRDIKPENILVDRRGRVKIADFGLAKIVGHDVDAIRLTAENQVMGTLHYMAPEQVEHPLAVDHRADIYSLGVVLYEMLTGDLPLGKFPPPSRKVSVDVRFDEVVLRALENDPALRYQQASEVKTRVEGIGTGPVPTPPAPALAATLAPASGTGRWGRRLGCLAIVAIVVGSVLLVPLTFFAYLRAQRSAERERDVARRVAESLSAAPFEGPPIQPLPGMLPIGNPPAGALFYATPTPGMGPVQEISFSDLIDFDTGRTMAYPKDGGAGGLFDGIGRLLAWMQSNGFDATASTGGLDTVGVRAVKLTAADWDSLDSAALAERIARGGAYLAQLTPGPDVTQPATYGYRTREGGLGMVQVVSTGGENGAAVVRLKSPVSTVESSPPAVP